MGCARQGELWLIDVSQAVDLDHPRALDFLREASAWPASLACMRQWDACCRMRHQGFFYDASFAADKVPALHCLECREIAIFSQHGNALLA